MSLLVVDSLIFKYSENNKIAVNDVSFEVQKGSYTAIIGLNGSGKSTLARLLCGLEEPSSGKITIQDNPRIGIIFQSPKDQIVSGIVYRDTEFGPRNLHLSSDEVELRTIESLNVVDMLDRADSSTSELSLGQTQKIALSGVIALRPDILILDEAIAMLDPASRSDILEFLRYWHKTGNTIIHITHDVDAIREAQQIIGMEEGKIYFDGETSDFFKNKDFVHKITGDEIPVLNKKLWNKKSDKVKSLSIKNLSFKYDNQHGINNISFDLYKGSVTALTGPSGAGKSTLMELCSGLLEPSDGSIFVFDSNKRPVLAQQNSEAALFETFAADDVAFGPENLGVKGDCLREVVKKSMNQAYLPFDKFGERQTFKLSGGEQRRLSIAGILAMDSNILFFDEPTAGLDSKGRTAILNLFRKLADEGKTVLFSTHKRDEADFSDREIIIKNGNIEFDSYSEAQTSEQKSESVEVYEVTAYGGVKMLQKLSKSSLSLAGKNLESTSFVQKLPSWLRILLFLVLFVLSLAGKTPLFSTAILCITAVYGMFSGFKVKNLVITCLKILPFLVIFAVFQMIFHPALEGEVHYTQWRWFLVTPSKLILCLVTILRTFSAIASICGFYISTPEYDLIDGFKILLKPLAVIGIPVRYVILILEVIFRFIPLLVDETSCIIKTQLIRGGIGKTKGKLSRIRAMLPLFVPMIIQTIKRSESLADAITVRCFK